MAPADVKELGLKQMLRQDIDGSIVELSVNGMPAVKSASLPTARSGSGTIGLALGYGRANEKNESFLWCGRERISLTWVLLTKPFSQLQLALQLTIPKETHRFAATQIQYTIMGREEALLREVSLKI